MTGRISTFAGRALSVIAAACLAAPLNAQRAPPQQLEIDIRPRMTAQGQVEVRFEMLDSVPFTGLPDLRPRGTRSDRTAVTPAELLRLDPTAIRDSNARAEAAGDAAPPPRDVQFTIATPPALPAAERDRTRPTIEEDCTCAGPADPVICLYQGRATEFANACRARCVGASECKVGTRDETPSLPPVVFHVYRVDEAENVRQVTSQAPAYPIPVREGNRRLLVGAATDPSAQRGQPYRYWVRAEDPRGNLLGSAASDVFVPHDGRPPAAVRGLRAAPTDTSIRLTWTGLDDAEATGYRLYREDARVGRAAPRGGASGRSATLPDRSTGPSSRWLIGDGFGGVTAGLLESRRLDIAEDATLVATLPRDATSYVDTRGLAPGVRYAYRITAFDPYSGEGAASAPALASLLDVTPPDPPGQFRAQARSGGVVAMVWQPSPSADVTQYRVERQVVSAGGWTPVMTVAHPKGRPTIGAEDHLDPRSQFTYRYRVAALDGAGNRSRSPPPVTLRLPDIVAPRAPAITELTTGEGVVRVGWSAPTDEDVTSYSLFRRRLDVAENAATLTPDGHTARFFDDATGVLGATYEYWVTAADGAGNESAPSRRHEQKFIGSITPVAPAAVQVRTDGNGRPLVTWTSQTGSIAIRYLVFRAPGANGPWAPVSGALADPRLVDAGARGTSWYRVMARYHTGQVSPPSEAVAWLRTARPGGAR